MRFEILNSFPFKDTSLVYTFRLLLLVVFRRLTLPDERAIAATVCKRFFMLPLNFHNSYD